MKTLYLIFTLACLSPIMPKTAISQNEGYQNNETNILALQLQESGTETLNMYLRLLESGLIKVREHEDALFYIESSFGMFKMSLKVIDAFISNQRSVSTSLDYPLEHNLNKTTNSITIYWDDRTKSFAFKVNGNKWAGGSGSSHLNKYFQSSVKGEI